MVLITGASGFIGKHYVDSIAKTNKELKIVSRKISEYLPSTAHEFIVDVKELVNGNEAVDNELFSGVSCIIHAAGVAHGSSQDIDEIHEVNTLYPIALAKLAYSKGVKRFIFISTANVFFDKVNRDVTANSESQSSNLYTESKRLAELGLLEFAQSSDMDIIVLRPPLVYGPNAPGNFNLLVKLIKLTPVLPFGVIKNRMSFLSIYNLADLLHYLSNKDTVESAVYEVSDNELISIEEFTNFIALALQKKLFQIPVPISLLETCMKIVGKKQLIPQLIEDSILNNDLIKNQTGWSPPYSVKESLVKFGEIS